MEVGRLGPSDYFGESGVPALTWCVSHWEVPGRALRWGGGQVRAPSMDVSCGRPGLHTMSRNTAQQCPNEFEMQTDGSPMLA